MLRLLLQRGPDRRLPLPRPRRFADHQREPPVVQHRDAVHVQRHRQLPDPNRFNGGQVGLKGEWHWNRWSLDGRTIIAIGDVSEEVDIFGSKVANGVASSGDLLTQAGTNIGVHRRNRFAWSPEAALNLGYQVTDHMRVFVGYDFLYLSDVVRAGDQVNLAVNPNPLRGGRAARRNRRSSSAPRTSGAGRQFRAGIPILTIERDRKGEGKVPVPHPLPCGPPGADGGWDSRPPSPFIPPFPPSSSRIPELSASPSPGSCARRRNALPSPAPRVDETLRKPRGTTYPRIHLEGPTRHDSPVVSSAGRARRFVPRGRRPPPAAGAAT